MEDKTILVIIAMILVAVMQMWALIMGHDGTILMSALAIIGGLAGYQIKAVKS